MQDAAESYRAQRAMAAVEEYLIQRGDGLVILLAAPFDKGQLDVGHITYSMPKVWQANDLLLSGIALDLWPTRA